MINNNKNFKFQYFLNLFLVTACVMGMLSLAPVDAKASTVLEQDTIGELEIDPFDPTRPFLLEGSLDHFGVDGKYLLDGRPADWMGRGGDFMPLSGAPRQMLDNDPGPNLESEAAYFARPESYQGRQNPLDLRLDLNKAQQRETYTDDIGREVDLNAESPRIEVVPMWNEITGYNWSPNTAVTLTIGSNNWTENTDDYGHVYFYVGSVQLPPGLEVVMTDGTFTGNHIIKSLVVTEINIDSDTVSGTTAPGSEIEVYTCDYYDYYDCYWLYPIADGSGNWQADFFGFIDIITESSGWASEFDEQGNSTNLYWTVPDPKISVYPVWDYVYSYGWPANTLIELYIDSTLVAAETASSWGDVNFNLNVDVVVGQAVMLTDGTYTRTHTVTNLAVTVIDQDLNAVSGTAQAGSEVFINGYDGYDWEEVTAIVSTSEQWTANFTYLDIDTGSYGYTSQYDAAGNSTNIYWHVSNPNIVVYPINDRVSGNDWTPNTIITLTIGANQWTSLSDDYGWVYFSNLPNELFPGQLVEMTDGTYTRSHTIFNLTITEVDQNADSIRGTAVSGSEIFVDGWDEITWEEVSTVADAQGNWSAIFSSLNITTGANGYAKQYDEAGNSTNIYWYIPDPYFQVYPVGDYMYGYRWPSNTTVTASVGGSVIGSGVSNKTGRVYISSESFNLQPGHIVTLTDGTYTRTHTVRNLAVTNIDQVTDTVSGTADANTALSYVSARNTLGQWFYRYPSADDSGKWNANFSGEVDIIVGTFGWAVQGDTAGNETCIRWNVPYPPSIGVYPQSNYIYGNNWTPNAPVTLTIGENQWTEVSYDWGGVSFNVSPFDIQPGQLVHMTDGTHTSTHTVTNLRVTSVDPSTDKVCGTAEQGSEVEVGTWESYYYFVRFATADDSGDWCADFSGFFDIIMNSTGNASQFDNARNSTNINWYVVDPVISVYPAVNAVHGSRWPADSDITLTIDETRESWTKRSSYWGSVYFELEDFDLQPGQLIEMSDESGVYTQSYVVSHIAVTDIDIDLDTISGTADFDSQIRVYACTGYECHHLDTNADGTGNWSANFSGIVNIAPGVSGWVDVYDANNNRTSISWRVEADHQIFLPLIVK